MLRKDELKFSGSIDDVIQKLESHSRTLIKWYENNYLKPNPDKWHLLFSEPGDKMKITIGNQCISNSACEKMLGIISIISLLLILMLLSYVKRQGKSYML